MAYIESSTCELKQEMTPDIKKEMVALLNTRGGVIYVGIDDEGKIYAPFAAVDKDEAMQTIASWIDDAIYPSATHLIDVEQEEGVIAIRIKEGVKKPYYLRNKGPRPSGVYKRIGTSTRMVSEDAIIRMIMDSSKFSYEKAISDEQDLTFSYFDSILSEKGIPTDRNQKVSLGLFDPYGNYTNLAWLLSDQSPTAVKVAEYDRNLDFKIKKTFTGPLLKVLSDVQEQVSRMNDVSATIDCETWVRTEKQSYPDPSLREIVLNAFCHGDYFIRSNIKVEFFPQEARITSPGPLYNASLEEILTGTTTYRNERLVHLLDKLGYIENFGQGIRRTIEAYAPYSAEPSFRNGENFFIVTLPNLNYDGPKGGEEAYEAVEENIQSEVSELGMATLKVIKKHPGSKASSIREYLLQEGYEVSMDSVRNTIRRDIYDYIEHLGSRKTGGYFIKGKEIRERVRYGKK